MNYRLEASINSRADRHNEDRDISDNDRGSQACLYLDSVKEGCARKLAHRWHGTFRVAQKCGDHALRLEIAGTPYRLIPMVHISMLKQVRVIPERPRSRLHVDKASRFDLTEQCRWKIVRRVMSTLTISK